VNWRIPMSTLTSKIVSVSSFEEECLGGHPDTCGMYEVEGESEFGFGPLPEGARLLVSLTDIWRIMVMFKLTLHPKNMLHVVFFKVRENPTKIDWHIFTDEQLEAMDEEERLKRPPLLH